MSSAAAEANITPEASLDSERRYKISMHASHYPIKILEVRDGFKIDPFKKRQMFF